MPVKLHHALRRFWLLASLGCLASHATGETDLPARPPTRCGLSGPVGAILVQPDGGILFAGGGCVQFVLEDGTLGHLQGTLARLHPDGALDPTFGCRAEPPSYSSVFDCHLARRADGALLLTGIFSALDGQPRARIALLRPDGSLDRNFVPWRDGTNQLAISRPFAPAFLRQAVFYASNRVVFPGLPRPPSSTGLRVFEMDNTGRVLGNRFPTNATGKFTGFYLSQLSERGLGLWRPVNWARAERTAWSLEPPDRRYVWEFFTAGEPLSAGDAAEVLKIIFAEMPVELCRIAARLPDGGAILLVQDGSAGRLMRFDQHWQADPSYTNCLRGRAVNLAVQADGRLLVARSAELECLGSGQPIGVARVNADGTLDESFRCETDERVMCLAAQPDGGILIGGFFRKANGVDAPWLARLNPDGSVDEEFQRHFVAPSHLLAGRRVPVRTAARREAAPSAREGEAAARSGQPTRESVLIQTLVVKDGSAVITFQGAANQTYLLQARDALDAGEWTTVATHRADAAGLGVLRDAGAAASRIRFYRVATP